MAFADPQSVTLAAVAVPLPRVSTGPDTSTYKSNDGLVKLTIFSSYGKRFRRTLRLEHSKIAPDPLVSDRNIRHSMTAFIVVDVPVTGYTVAQQKEVVDGFLAYLSASTGASITKALGGEN